MTSVLEYLAQLIQLCMARGQCITRDPTLAAAMVFSMVNGTLVLYHIISVIGKTSQSKLEREIIEAAITYLTK